MPRSRPSHSPVLPCTWGPTAHSESSGLEQQLGWSGPNRALPSPGYRAFALWPQAVVTAAAGPHVPGLSSDPPGGCGLTYQVPLQAQTADSLPGRHSRALASLQVDRLDASESLRKQEEHVVEPTPLLFGRWHPIACPLSPSEGRQFIPPCPGWASDWGGNGWEGMKAHDDCQV